MRKFSFPAQKLLALRQKLLRQAEIVLAHQVAERQRALAQLEHARHQVQNLSRPLADAIRQASACSSFWQMRSKIDSACARWEDAARACQRLDHAFRKAQNAVRTLRNQVEALQTFRDRAWVQYRRQQQRLAQHQADDHAQTRWQLHARDEAERTYEP